MDIKTCTLQLMELENELVARDCHSKDIFNNSPQPQNIKIFTKIIEILNAGANNFFGDKDYKFYDFFKALDRQIDMDFFNENGNAMQHTLSLICRFCRCELLSFENNQFIKKENKLTDLSPATIKHVVNTDTEQALQGLILKNGDFYPLGNGSHSMLISYLTASGIDLVGALRLTYSPKCNFIFSSFRDYEALNNAFSNECSIEITTAQAQTIVELYDGLTEGAKVYASLNEILINSNNLGYDFGRYLLNDKRFYDDDSAKLNFTKLYRALDEKYQISKNPRQSIEVFTVLERALDDNDKKRARLISAPQTAQTRLK